ncbi:MAG: hypothetical protein P8I83_06800, partial [Paracoccaceae bacterium]|nr:hypothetical protein [Paracoccaceae bacterium]
ISSLDLSIDFETDLEIAALEMLPTAGINLAPQQTEIVEPNSYSLANLDSVQKFSSIPPVLPESIPQLRNILGGKPSSGTWLRTVSTPIQEITLLTKPEVRNAEQQNQSASGIGFTTLDKPERPSPLRLQPAKLSKHKIDNSGQSPTGRPLIIIRPIPRPTDGAETISEQDQASVLRPKSRPSSVQPIFPEANEDILSTSLRPKKRPNNIKRVESVIVARVFSPEDEGDEANISNYAYSSTNDSRVSSKATIVNVLDLRNINLIGVYLSLGKRSALIRLSSGKRVMVKIGDKLDGGKVAAIGDTELRYIKRGQNITLELPKG